MAIYQYQMRQPNGAVTTGQVTANSLSEASGIARQQDGYLLDVSPVGRTEPALLARLRNLRIEFGPGLKEVLNFTSQLSVMIKAGINVRGAVESVAEQTDNLKFRKIVDQIRLDVESGKPFSEALARHPKVFNPLYVNMVRASEMSGSFGYMLERIATYLRQQVETRSMVRGAMIYPAIIAVMAVGTTVFLLTFVLPRFSDLFAGKESLLPMPTKALLGLSWFLRTYWYVVTGAVVALVGGFLYFIRTTVGRIWWDKTKLQIPMLKRMFRALYITRGLQTMGEMINAGVPMLDTLQITADVSGNVLFRDLWMKVHESVKGGRTIADPLAGSKLLPRHVVQMVAAGEESGKLGEVLAEVSDFYGKELRNTIKAVTAMLEPIMIVLMGAVVGFIAMSIILPIFKMSSLVK
jgi:type IV pilus assembly protein PilC